MKKTAVLLLLSFFCTAIANAAGLPWYESSISYVPSGPTATIVTKAGIYEDFTDIESPYIIKTAKAEYGGFISAAEGFLDGTSLKIGVNAGEKTATCDPYIATPTFKGVERVYFSYDMSADDVTTGSYNSYFRNCADANGYTFLSMNAKGVLTYLPSDSANKVSVTIASGQRFTVGVLYDAVAGKMAVFHNGKKITATSDREALSIIDVKRGYYFRCHASSSASSIKAYGVNIDNLFAKPMNKEVGNTMISEQYIDFENTQLEDVALAKTPKSENGGFISTAENILDGTSLKLGVNAGEKTATCDPHIATSIIKGKKKISFSYDMSIDDISTGTFNSYFRNTADAFGYTFLSIDKQGNLTYLPMDEENKVSVPITSMQRFTVGITYDAEQEKLQVFHNGEQITSTTDAEALSIIDSKRGYTFRCHAISAASSTMTYTVNLDNISVKVFRKETPYFIGTAENYDGTVNAESVHFAAVNDTEETINCIAIVADYTSENQLASIEKTEVALAPFSGQIIPVQCRDVKNAKIRGYLLDSLSTVTPLAPSASITLLSKDALYGDNYVLHGSNLCVPLERGADHLKTLFLETAANQHPRIMTTAAELNALIQNSSIAESKQAFLTKVAAPHLKRGIQSDGSDDGYYSYNVVGGRLLTVSRRVKNALLDLSLAYKLTGDTQYKAKIWEILTKVIDYPDWHPSHMLDTGELAAGVAVAYDWLYSDWTSKQRSMIEQSIIDNAIVVAEKAYAENAGWTREKVNRNIVNNGGMLMAAMAMADIIGDRAFSIADSALAGIEYMLPSFGPDGAWEEGIAYAQYMLEYLSKTFSTVEACFGSDLGLSDTRGLDRLNYFVYYGNSAKYRYQFHDDGSSTVAICPEQLYLIRLYNDQQALALYNAQFAASACNTTACDLLWGCKGTTDFAAMPLDGYFRDVEFLAMRNSYISGAVTSYLAFHGGRTDPEHNHHHCDCGHFELDLLGERWACDLGTDSLAYNNVANDGTQFTGTAADIYRKRAEGHNCLVINPDETSGQIAMSEAKVISHFSDADSACAILDMSEVYEGITECQRKYELLNQRSEAQITDTINLPTESDVYWFMHTQADCTKDGNTIVLTRNGKSVRLSVECNTDFSLDIVDAAPLPTSPVCEGQADNSMYRKVQIHLNTSGNVEIKVKIQPCLE